MSVRSLQHIALAVPDLAAGQRFYEDFGLAAHAAGNRIAMRCEGRDQDQVVLIEAPRRRMHHVAFGTTEDGLAAVKQRLQAAGTTLVDAPAEAPAAGLWFHDPDGLLINLRAEAAAPWRDAPEWRINTPGHYTRLGSRGYPSRDMVVRPRRLGHALRFSPDINRQVDFYTRVLGLRLSDRSRDIVAFFHCEGGSDHHVFGFIAGEKPGFHHASFEVANIDEIGRGARRLIEMGYRDGWGFGRHVIGSNFFHYVRDPWNSLAEYFCDIDYIPAGQAWEAKDWPPEDSLYVWGPDVPADFGTNFEATS